MFVNGSNLTLPGNSAADTGDISVAAGLTLGINGNRTFGVGADITGTGNLDVMGGTVSLRNIPTGALTVSGGAATFNNASTPSSISISGGTATFNALTNTGGQLTLSGTGERAGTGIVLAATGLWTGGTMSNSGATSISGLLTISGTGAKTFNQALLVANGGVTWTGTGLSRRTAARSR